MHRKILLWGLLLALLSVLLGAFGAHSIKNIVDNGKVAIFETGVRYQFMHGVALILFSFYIQINRHSFVNQKQLNNVAAFFLIGTTFFSGSLYMLSLQPLCSFNYARFIGPITPIGGVFFILGWSFWIRIAWLHKVDK